MRISDWSSDVCSSDLAVDAMVAAGRDPGPLAGLPFGVKDNYDAAGRITTAGSIINRERAPAVRDAILLERLTASGAVLVGPKNRDERSGERRVGQDCVRRCRSWGLAETK